MSLVTEQYRRLVEYFQGSDPVTLGLVFGSLVCLSPLLLIIVLPRQIPKYVMNFMVSLAVGGLLGDIFLHIFPHSFAAHEHNHDLAHEHHHHDHHEHSSPDVKFGGVLIITGFLIFLTLDKLLEGGEGHSHGCSHDHEHPHSEGHKITSGKSTSTSSSSQKIQIRKRKNSENNMTEKEKEHSNKAHTRSSSVGCLLSIANLVHTLTDGFQLGLAFVSGNAAFAVSTAIAVLLHEIPHKLGDFSVLLNSGMSFRDAFLMQIFTSMGTVIGLILVIGIAPLFKSLVDLKQLLPGDPSKTVILVASGGLLYTVTMAILPEIKKSSGPSFYFQLLGIVGGVWAMSLLADGHDH